MAETISGKVESAQIKIGQKAGEYKVYVISGLSMSDFDKKNSLFPVGAEVEVTYETNEKGFKNIKSIMRIDDNIKISSPPKNTEKKIEFPYSDALAEVLAVAQSVFHFGDIKDLPLNERIRILEALSAPSSKVYSYRNWQGVSNGN